MSNDSRREEDALDVRLLARQELCQESFPGGRTQGFRVFFTPEVHASLWTHAALDTGVEVCGVLVGSWHRDGAGPFVKVIESIRGEGADTRFAEVTFTHQTWAKINAEMDTKFAHLSIVGWYHTHPDFGIFLSDRDRFIQEHFFSGPGQIAHVIDPVRQIEGVFVWKEGKPCVSDHFWVGDHIVAGPAASTDLARGQGWEGAAHARPGRAGAQPAGAADPARGPVPLQASAARVTPLLRLAIYCGVFLMGYVLANILSAWDHQRFVANVLASNGFLAVARLGLSEELDRVRGDLAAIGRTLEAALSKTEKSDAALGEIRAQLGSAAQRIALIKQDFGNTPEEDAMLRRLVRDLVARRAGLSELPVTKESK